MAKSLKSASRKADLENKLNQLDNLGTSKESFEESSMSVAEYAVGEFIERIHQNIEKEGMNTTGSINDIEIRIEGNTIELYANPHLIYQDMGVNGSKVKLYDTPFSYSDKMPPYSAFKEWILTKNIQLKDNAKYYGKESPFKELTEEQQVKSASFAIARKIFNEGFKPRNIYTKEIPKLMEDLESELVDAVIKQMF